MKGTVLIVEDEPDVAGLLEEVLREDGYSPVLATASRAAERSRELAPAAVIMDYLMPALNGAEVIERIRDATQPTPPPVILVTGLADAARLARESGADAYLRKPFDMEDLLKVLHDVLEKS